MKMLKELTMKDHVLIILLTCAIGFGIVELIYG